MTAQLTVITSRRPAMLSKTVQRGPDGSLLREGGGLLVEGHAEIATVSSLGELAALLQRLGPAQALTFGLPRGGEWPHREPGRAGQGGMCTGHSDTNPGSLRLARWARHPHARPRPRRGGAFPRGARSG